MLLKRGRRRVRTHSLGEIGAQCGAYFCIASEVKDFGIKLLSSL